jgi:hypothetical protein
MRHGHIRSTVIIIIIETTELCDKKGIEQEFLPQTQSGTKIAEDDCGITGVSLKSLKG